MGAGCRTTRAGIASPFVNRRGAAGIGRAAALAFAKRGAAVVIADVDEAEGEAAAHGLREQGHRALFMATDVARAGDVERMVAAATSEFGGLDWAFNNAGIEGPQRGHGARGGRRDRLVAVNLKSVWLRCGRRFPP